MNTTLIGLEEYEYVTVNVQAWETLIGTNCRDITRRLAQRGRVLFVNPPLDWSSKLRPGSDKARMHRKSEGKHQGNRLVEVESNIWVLYPKATLTSINWLPDNALYDLFNRHNNTLLADEIRWALSELKMNRYILFNDSEMFRGFYLKELLRPNLYVYYVRDNLLAVDYWQRHGKRLEPALMRKADLVVGNSAYLASIAAQYNLNSVDVGQGCDLTQFVADADYPLPDDLAAIPQPRIGYTGALTTLRLDIPLLEHVASERPQWQLVLVGPEDEEFRSSRLHSMPNVHFLGLKPVEHLPAYLHHLDVLINPQLLNPITIGNYPRKVDEYLAMGKPVVAVRTETMELFRSQVLLAENLAQFIDCVELALLDEMPSTSAERVAFAQGHSWENSVQALERAIADSFALVS